jgi:hypothetical protein
MSEPPIGFERPAIEPSTDAKKRKLLDRARDLRPYRRDRLADVARLELREPLAVGHDCVGKCVEEARSLVRGVFAPRAVEGGACRRTARSTSALARDRSAGEHVPRCRLVDIPSLAGRRARRSPRR